MVSAKKKKGKGPTGSRELLGRNLEWGFIKGRSRRGKNPDRGDTGEERVGKRRPRRNLRNTEEEPVGAGKKLVGKEKGDRTEKNSIGP